MSFVTPAHVRQLAEAEFSDLPVLAIDIDGEIEVFPQSTAQARGAEILTDAAALHDYTDGGELDDTLAEQFAAEINEAHGLGEGSEYTDDTTGDPMRIINLTPHPVTLVTVDGSEVVIQPEETPVRIPAETTPAGEINGIPLVREQLGDADSVLPEPQPGVVYVVARPVAERANRPDLLVPTQVERVDGRPVRARALARVAASSPRTAAADAIIRIAETAIIDERDYPAGLELLEVAARVRRGSIPDFRGVALELATLKRAPAASDRLRREIRTALSVLRGIEDAYVADVQSNPPACLPCSECGGTGQEQAVPTA